MENNTLFKPSPKYKELMILTMIENNEDISQRIISKRLNISLAMVNAYLIDCEKNKYIKVLNRSGKSKYMITKLGLDRIKVLNIGLLKSTLDIYNFAKDECLKFLNNILEKGFKNILFYGAGEVAEILLYVLSNSNYDVNVLGIIDDDVNKQGSVFVNIPVISLDDINRYNNIDGILVSSYTNQEIINNKLYSIGYDKKKILNFFK